MKRPMIAVLGALSATAALTLAACGSSTGPSKLTDISEIYYVLAGAGKVTVNDETAPIKKGDAIPVDMGETKYFVQTGSEPLEMYAVGVARDMEVKSAIPDKPTRSIPEAGMSAPAAPAH